MSDLEVRQILQDIQRLPGHESVSFGEVKEWLYENHCENGWEMKSVEEIVAW